MQEVYLGGAAPVWGFSITHHSRDFLQIFCQPSVVEHFRSQQHSSGTAFLTMSRRPIRCRLFSSNWNTPCSSSHSQTLLCDICLTITPIVVLAVASLLIGHSKSSLIDWLTVYLFTYLLTYLLTNRCRRTGDAAVHSDWNRDVHRRFWSEKIAFSPDRQGKHRVWHGR